MLRLMLCLFSGLGLIMGEKSLLLLVLCIELRLLGATLVLLDVAHSVGDVERY